MGAACELHNDAAPGNFNLLFRILALIPLKVPTEDAAPDVQPASPRVPLPPPIIPEMEDSTPSPVSDTSSGYISTSVSAATLSDVYTLSWDLPPPCGRKADGFEALPGEEEEGLEVDPRPLAREALLAWDQPSEPGSSLLDSSPAQREAYLCVTAQPRGGAPETGRDANAEPVGVEEESAIVRERETDQREPPPKDESPPPGPELQTEEASVCSESPEASPQVQPRPDQSRSDPAQGQIPEDPPASVLPPPSSGGQVRPDEAGATPELPTTDFPPASAPPADQAQSGPARPPKANPFKIQKVKSSDLKSFQPFLGTEEAPPPQANNSLTVPTETLEIISDSEEGDAATAALPDWLKEGEFVTVGGNKSGTVRYVGPTDFAKGTWVGVELEVPAGEQGSPIPSGRIPFRNLDLFFRNLSREERRLRGREALLPLQPRLRRAGEAEPGDPGGHQAPSPPAEAAQRQPVRVQPQPGGPDRPGQGRGRGQSQILEHVIPGTGLPPSRRWSVPTGRIPVF